MLWFRSQALHCVQLLDEDLWRLVAPRSRNRSGAVRMYPYYTPARVHINRAPPQSHLHAGLLPRARAHLRGVRWLVDLQRRHRGHYRAPTPEVNRPHRLWDPRDLSGKVQVPGLPWLSHDHPHVGRKSRPCDVSGAHRSYLQMRVKFLPSEYRWEIFSWSSASDYLQTPALVGWVSAPSAA